MSLEHLIKTKGLEGLGRYYSIYRGTVASNEDPEFRCRIQLKVPDVYGKDVNEDWALPRGMPAGKDIGLIILPQKGDTVWVTFENGNPDHPVWEHGYFAENQTLTPFQEGGKKPSVMVWQGYNKERIVMDKEKGVIRIEDKSGDVEFAIMGETLVDLLEKFVDDIGTITGISLVINTALSGPITSATNWTVFSTKWKAQFKTALSKFLKHS